MLVFLIIAVCFLVAHAVTALLVTPLQIRLLPEISVFASLLYLPHGVRVLAIWIWGWRAIPALFVGNYIAMATFSDASLWALVEPSMAKAVLAASSVSLIAFQALSCIKGRHLYGPGVRTTDWREIILVAIIASAMNSAIQARIFGGFLPDTENLTLVATYLLGDILGTTVLLLVLMMIFRLLRD